MSGYRLSAPAEADMRTIFWDGIERFGERRAETYLEGLEHIFAFLSRHPEAARLRKEISPPVRAYPKEAHVIIYEIMDGGVVILRIRSALENWTANPLGNGQ